MKIKLERDRSLASSTTVRVTVRWGLLYVFWHNWHPCLVWLPRSAFDYGDDPNYPKTS